LNLVTKELSSLGISLDSATYHQHQHQAPPEPTSAMPEKAPENPFLPGPVLSNYQPPPPISPPTRAPADYLFQSQGGADSFGPDPMAMEARGFEAMSSLEPLSAWVGTIPEYDQLDPS
jgi:hypothetical protein